jgi:AcrR family transcriptional regulator
MVRKADRPKHIVESALAAAVETGWARLSLRDIAMAADMSLAEVHAIYPGKPAILAAFLRDIDAAVLAGDGPVSQDESPRDRLFDVLMRRFDALNAHRAAVIDIMDAQTRDPLSALALAPCVLCSLSLMLEAADIGVGGVAGALRVKGLTAVWLATLRVWRGDESPDMAATMAALDRNLGRAERWARRLPPRFLGPVFRKAAA